MVLSCSPTLTTLLQPILSHEIVVDALFLLGLLIVAKFLLSPLLTAACAFYKYFLRPSKNLKKSYGEWAVVTGATDGIGKAYAEQLAKKGLNILLVSRSQEKLTSTSKDIESKYNVKTSIYVVDFNDFAPHSESFSKHIENMNIGVLVNNVGVSYDSPAYFEELSEQELSRLIQVNITSLTLLTRLVAPKMLAAKKGAIINISSFSAFRPTPLLTVYSAAKAYVDYFSRGLELEYRGKGIFVQSVLPLLVVSKLSKVRSASFTVPSPNAFAKQAVASIGYETRVVGHWSHALQNYFISLIPGFLSDKFILDHHKSLRARALIKKQREASGSKKTN